MAEVTLAKIGLGIAEELAATVLLGAATKILLPAQKQSGPRLSDLHITGAASGEAIPEVFGRGRVAGTIIWSGGIRELQSTDTITTGKFAPDVEQTNYRYLASFAVLLCRGPIIGIRTIRTDGHVVYNVAPDADPATRDRSTTFAQAMTVYLGAEDQDPDPVMQAALGVDNTPAFRGLAYVVFTDLDLACYGGRIPTFSFEVVTAGSVTGVTPYTLEAAGDPNWGMAQFRDDLSTSDTVVYVLYSTWARARRNPATGAIEDDVVTTNDHFWLGGANNSALYAGQEIMLITEATDLGAGLWKLKVTREYSDPITNAPSVLQEHHADDWFFAKNYGLHFHTADDLAYVADLGVAGGFSDLFSLTDAARTAEGTTGNNWLALGRAGVGTVFQTTTFATVALHQLVDIFTTDVATYQVGQAVGGTLFSLLDNDLDEGSYVTIPGLRYVRPASIVDADPVNVADILRSLATRAGYADADVDTSLVPDTVDGYLIDRQMTYREALEPLLQAFFLDVVETGPGTIRFQPRAGAAVLALAAGDLGAREEGAEAVSPVEVTVRDQAALPREVAVEYLDVDAALERATQHVRMDAAATDTVVTVPLPIACGAQQARRIADVLLMTAWWESREYRFALPRKYLALEPGDKVTLPTLDVETATVRLLEVTIGANRQLEVRAVRHDDSCYVSTLPADSPLAPEAALGKPSSTDQLYLNLPCLLDAESLDGFYLAGGSAETTWRTGTLWRAEVLGGLLGTLGFAGEWQQALDVRTGLPVILEVPSTYGVTVGSLAAASSTDTWDADTHTVDVELTRGALLSSTESAVLNGANRLLVGGEILQFRDATLIGTNTYRLSRLLRGRRGTENLALAHVALEPVVLLATALFVGQDSGDRGRSWFYKLVPNGGSPTIETDGPSQRTFAATGRCLMPWSPVQLHGTRDGSLNLTVTWVRRSRIGHTLTSGADIPLGEESEVYDVEIMSSASSSATVKRTFSGLTARTASYTAAQQTTDFGATQSAITVKVYQRSAAVGRGIPGQATV